jgi:hypothetical protein
MQILARGNWHTLQSFSHAVALRRTASLAGPACSWIAAGQVGHEHGKRHSELASLN